MKQNIHPEYHEIKATCSCGNIIIMKSTISEPLKLDVCSECHPFYTGKQKLIDTGGRIDKFEKRFGKKQAPKTTKAAPAEETPETVSDEKTEAPVEETPKAVSDKKTKAPVKEIKD